MTTPRVLIYDLESAPNVGYTWRKWDQNVIEFVEEWYLLTVGWKWLGERQVHVMGLDDYEGYVPGSPDDSALAWLLRDLFDEADVAVTHNGNAFDQPKARSRMLVHGIDPPSPFKEVDTLKVSRHNFGFNTHTLADICERLGLDLKGKPGWDTWPGCMQGDPVAWKRMKRYNVQDVKILEQVYLRFLPWMTPTQHPNLAIIADRPKACPKCLAEGTMIVRGRRQNQTTTRVQYQCTNCRSYVAGRPLQHERTQFVT